MGQGRFRPLDARVATLQFLNLHNHTYQWVKPDGRWDAAQLSREYCDTLLRAFAAPGAVLPDVEAAAELYLMVAAYSDDEAEALLRSMEGDE